MSFAPRLVRTLMAAEPAVAKVPIPRRGVDYRGKIVLAPMVRTGELPTRLMALHYGADLVWTRKADIATNFSPSNPPFLPGPETVDHSLLGTTRHVNPATNTIDWTRVPHHGQKSPPPDAKENVIFRVHPGLEGSRLIMQLGTSDPARAVQAARLVAGDVAGVDVNAGCPKPFSTTGGMGAALLRDPDRLCAILSALVGELSAKGSTFGIGVSVKIRLLETAAETEALVRRLVATGITGLTVHCRTTPMRPRERAIRGQLRMVADVCRDAGVACLMNGDVETRDGALDLIREYGVDGAMIATAAEKNPSCFRPADLGGIAPWEEVVALYVRLAMETDNRFANTKFLLANLVPGKRPQYQPTQRAQTYLQVCEALGLTDQAMLEMARGVDARLELDAGRKAGKKNNKSASNSRGNQAALASGGNMAKARGNAAKQRRTLSKRGANSAASSVASPPAPSVELTLEAALLDQQTEPPAQSAAISA